MAGTFGLGWSRFARLAVVLIAVTGFFVFLDFRGGGFDVMSVPIVILGLSTLGFSAYRWSRMRAAHASGVLTEAEFHRMPLKFLAGRLRYALAWYGITMFLMFLPVAWWIYQQQSAA